MGLPKDVIQKGTLFHFEKDRIRFLIGRLLILKMLKMTNASFSLNELKYEEYGKPYFDNTCHFNISHAGDYILLCYSDQPVGIDVECVTCSIPNFEFKDFFHPEEIRQLENNKQADLFYSIWTKKEAIVKAHGLGLNSRLSEINTLLNNKVYFDEYIYFTDEIKLCDGYSCHIATTQEWDNIKKYELKASELE